MTVGRLAGIPGIAEAPVGVAVELDGGPAHPDAGAKIVVRLTTSTATATAELAPGHRNDVALHSASLQKGRDVLT
jgi:hypothetical protein